MKHTPRRFIFALISAAKIASLFLMIYIVVTVLLDNFKLFEYFTDRLILRYVYLRFSITLTLLLGYIGWFLARKYTSMEDFSITAQPLKYKIFYLGISLLLAGFYIDPLEKGNILIFWGLYLCLTYFFYLFIPKLIFFFANWNFLGLSYWRKKEDSYQISQREYAVLFTSVIIVCIGIFSILLTSARYIQGEIMQENYLRQSTHITEVVPVYTTNAERISLVGYNLGWGSNEDKRYGLYIQNEKIEQIEIWQDTMITFTLPLHIEPGLKTVWITRPKDMLKEKSPKISSNKMNIQIVPRLEYLPSEFDSRETKLIKKINAKYQSIKSTIKRILYEE